MRNIWIGHYHYFIIRQLRTLQRGLVLFSINSWRQSSFLRSSEEFRSLEPAFHRLQWQPFEMTWLQDHRLWSRVNSSRSYCGRFHVSKYFWMLMCRREFLHLWSNQCPWSLQILEHVLIYLFLLQNCRIRTTRIAQNKYLHALIVFLYIPFNFLLI